ncbi:MULTISPECIES: NUDIX hydrolase [unclassified Brevibacterium]|uniref:NUDIX hydrolase n=1 Tax=unclassified Brevibacterium TaxID=2614124 RepID=UPI001E5589F5|nr:MULTISPECIES: NUDIX hydrolase [unclassified Brevibacterium]MDK8435364.1 NUDIX hydrolase [Brevibacterium sp. H-BE7]
MSEPEWEFVSKSVVHRGYLTLSEHQVRLPTGESIRYEVDESVPFNVAVLGLTEEGHLRLARQYRYPIRRWIYDLPGGGAEHGEAPIDAAAREYEEETGLRPVDLTHLFTFFQNPARMAFPVHLYFCRDTVPGTPITDDPQEVVRTVTMPVTELDRLTAAGEIIDPPLLISRMVAAQRGILPPVHTA